MYTTLVAFQIWEATRTIPLTTLIAFDDVSSVEHTGCMPPATDITMRNGRKFRVVGTQEQTFQMLDSAAHLYHARMKQWQKR